MHQKSIYRPLLKSVFLSVPLLVASSWEYDPCSRASLFSVLWLSCNLKFVVTEMLSEHCWNFLWSVQALIRGLRPPQTPYNVHASVG